MSRFTPNVPSPPQTSYTPPVGNSLFPGNGTSPGKTTLPSLDFFIPTNSMYLGRF